jgi:quercetin dioxygenase-like cupin family protein
MTARVLLTLLVLCGAASAQDRPSVKCVENSPERRGEEGCSLLAVRPFAGSTAKPLFWHLDRFDALETATKAAGPDGVAAEAHGSVWLMTLEARGEEHHGGRHVTWIGPLSAPAAEGLSMRVHSTFLREGTTTPVHTHSGPEVFYIVDGAQCLDTQEKGNRLGPGESFILPTDTVHQGRSPGPGPRKALGMVLFDSARPSSHDLADPPPLKRCE